MRYVAPVVIVALIALAVACKGNGGKDVKNETPSGGVPSGAFAQACQKSDEKQFSGPEQVIDPGKTYVATIKTAKGDIVVDLDSGVAVTTNSFVFLACKGFYNGLIFHRVADDPPVIQGGDPTGTGGGGPGYAIPGEFEGAVFDEGVIGMARAEDPDSAGSQFFIMKGPAHYLDDQYAAFGHVTQGMDVAKQIAVGDVIETITIEER